MSGKNNWLKGAFAWMLDQAIEHWVSIVAVIGASAMTYFASISAFLNQYGAVAWGAVGIVSGLLLAIVFWLISMASVGFANAQLKKSMAVTPVSVNPLRTNFESEKVKIADFYSPFHIINSGKHFKNCEIHGPGALAILNDNSLYSPGLLGCDLVQANEVSLFTAAGFERSTFENCKFFNMVIFLPPLAVEAIIKDTKKHGKVPPQIIGVINIETNKP